MRVRAGCGRFMLLSHPHSTGYRPGRNTGCDQEKEKERVTFEWKCNDFNFDLLPPLILIKKECACLSSKLLVSFLFNFFLFVVKPTYHHDPTVSPQSPPPNPVWPLWVPCSFFLSPCALFLVHLVTSFVGQSIFSSQIIISSLFPISSLTPLTGNPNRKRNPMLPNITFHPYCSSTTATFTGFWCCPSIATGAREYSTRFFFQNFWC